MSARKSHIPTYDFRFKFYNERYGHQSRALWHVVNPRVNFQKHITIDCVDSDFLNYLHTHAVVLEVWGLQGKLQYCFTWIS